RSGREKPNSSFAFPISALWRHPLTLTLSPVPGARGIERGGRGDMSAPLRRPCLAQPQLLDHRLAHQIFLHLAGDRHGEGVDEADVVRDLVMGDLALAEGGDLLCGEP